MQCSFRKYLQFVLPIQLDEFAHLCKLMMANILWRVLTSPIKAHLSCPKNGGSGSGGWGWRDKLVGTKSQILPF